MPAPAADILPPRSDGRVLHVDFEHYVEGAWPILNAGVRTHSVQNQVEHVVRSRLKAFSGSQCGFIRAEKIDEFNRLELQPRFGAPRLRGAEIAEFVFRPSADKPVDLRDFGVWLPVRRVGIAVSAHSTVARGTYRLDVHDKNGTTTGVVKGLKESGWLRIILARDRKAGAVDLWVGSPDQERWIGRYADRNPKSAITNVYLGDLLSGKGRGSGYWDDVRIGKPLTDGGRLAPSERITHVGLAPPDIGYPIVVGRSKQLFVDHIVAQSLRNVSRTLHSVRKHADNPLVMPDQPWEGVKLLLYGGVIKDPFHNGLFRMWYLAFRKTEGLPSYICYAESEDGLTWRKPNLGLLADDTGSKNNNIVMPAWSDTTILFDPEDPNPAHRYKCMNRLGGHTGWTSPDGFRWKRHKQILRHALDCSTVAWDPIGRKWMASIKMASRNRRVRGYAEGKDFFSFGDACFMLDVDKRDGPKDSIYALVVSYYETVYLGLLRMYGGLTHRLDIQWATSRNGTYWDRPFRKPLIPTTNRLGAWDYGNNAPSTCPPIRVGDELWFYYSGRKMTHSAEGKNPTLAEGETRAAIGLGTLRVDGFVSVDGGPKGGVVTTHPLILENRSLYVNADAARGLLSAEILGADSDQPIGRFTKANCRPMTADKVRHRITWAGSRGLRALKRRPIRLRFGLIRAKLYAFWTE